MPDIKTRDVVKGTIKTLDKSSIVTQKMKSAYVSIKDKAQNSVDSDELNMEEYANNRVKETTDSIANKGFTAFKKTGEKSLSDTKDNIIYFNNKITEIRARNNIKKAEKVIKTEIDGKPKGDAKTKVKTMKNPIKLAKNKVPKKNVVNAANKTVKTAKNTQKAAQATITATKKAAVIAKATAKGVATTIKAIISGLKALVEAIVAGGWVAVVVIVVLCIVGLVASSVYGIFFSGESDTENNIRTAIHEINLEYDNHIEEIKVNNPHDKLEMSGSRAVWKDVLAVYAVKTNTDPNDPQEIATMNEHKKELLKNIFWEMNVVESRTESVTETVITETDDGNGNIVETETQVTYTYLYITVTHKTIDEMVTFYGFNEKQKEYLTDLLKPENNSMWSSVLYGISSADGDIVNVALSQVGNIGGQPYWSWYGFNSRVEWCACFVSWCANECGYIDNGIIPKFAGCVIGSQWFKDRGQWADNSYTPKAGTIIFFDWEQDGITDHVGIVEKCENGVVYTVEGNSGDMCRERQYSVGSNIIYDYGIL